MQPRRNESRRRLLFHGQDPSELIEKLGPHGNDISVDIAFESCLVLSEARTKEGSQIPVAQLSSGRPQLNGKEGAA